MHGKDTFSEFREFINTMESRVQELGKAYGVEHLAGPQGFAVRYLFENQDKEIFIKDIEKKLSISKSKTGFVPGLRLRPRWLNHIECQPLLKAPITSLSYESPT